MERRSRSVKDDKNEDASINSSQNNVGVTRRKSAVRHSDEVLNKIYELSYDTPRKKKENIGKTKLTDDDISQHLNMVCEGLRSSSNSTSKNSNTGKQYESTLTLDQGIIMKIKLTNKQNNLVIGDKKKEIQSHSKSNETKQKLRRTINKVNYAEDELMKKHEEEVKSDINTAYLRKAQKNNKFQATKQEAENSSRKRAKENTQPGFQIDENVSQAHQISSPPKRPKSETEIERTPKKNSLSDVQCTPRSAAKRKILSENEFSDTRRNTRSTSFNCGEKYAKSHDNVNKLEREPQVVLDKYNKTTPKITNKPSTKIGQSSESGESEIENKSFNANKCSTWRNTRSKSMQTPTKDMQKLNISKDVGTPKSSRTSVAKLRTNNIQQTNIEKQDDVPCRRSRRIPPTYYGGDRDSTDESRDSSDNYEEEESLDSEDDSIESGNDSADEFQEFNKRKNYSKISKTPRARNRVTKTSMATPTKAIAKMSIGTPTLDKHRRTISINKPSTPLQKARATLHVSAIPKSLPCREEQFNDIYSFLHARLSDGSGGCIYISGVPGTGKTATVSEVIRCLKKSMTKGELDDFDYIDINGMKLSEPRQAYVQIWRQMTAETKTWEEAHKLLQNKFINSNSKRKMTLLLVDELDLLCNKRQDVVYNLLDWPSKANAKLVVVTIANTMDLPERILMGKVTSRLGLTRLTFPPYNFKQLEEIVVSRLKGANAFGGETIQLVARKVAAVSGDARRALDICRRAAEIAEKNGRELVSMIDVKQALDEMIASPKIQAIKHCSEMEKYFLKGVCTEVQRTGLEEVVFKSVYMQMQTLCSLDGLRAPNESEALEMCARLGSWRLLLCDHSRLDIHQRLLLNVSTDDVYFATKDINE